MILDLTESLHLRKRPFRYEIQSEIAANAAAHIPSYMSRQIFSEAEKAATAPTMRLPSLVLRTPGLTILLPRSMICLIVLPLLLYRLGASRDIETNGGGVVVLEIIQACVILRLDFKGNGLRSRAGKGGNAVRVPGSNRKLSIVFLHSWDGVICRRFGSDLL